VKLTRTLERVAIGIASLALSVTLIGLLSGFFAAHDPAGVSGSANGPGQQFRDLGHAHLQPGQLRPAPDSDPPTSGAHIPEPVLQDGGELTVNQLLGALEVGDVVIMYGGPRPPPGLQSLARSLAGPFTPALARAGQAVILAQRPETAGLTALAWTHVLQVSTPNDPRLRQFAEFWLGKGAPGR
jgi:hypothetical protein